MCAVGLFIIGSIMIWNDVQAEGTIDIKSTIIVGSVKSGSAGILLVFIAFVLLLTLLLLTSKKPHSSSLKTSAVNKLGNSIKWIFLALIVSVCLIPYHPAFGGLAIFLGFALIPSGVAYLTFLENDK